jgi:hypothetical protein
MTAADGAGVCPVRPPAARGCGLSCPAVIPWQSSRQEVNSVPAGHAHPRHGSPLAMTSEPGNREQLECWNEFHSAPSAAPLLPHLAPVVVGLAPWVILRRSSRLRAS